MPRELGIEEWEALFLGDVAFPEPERGETEERDEFLKRWELDFAQHMSGLGFELLGRIWHYNMDVFYYPREIEGLLAECRELKKHVGSKLGKSGLQILISSCEEAIRVGSGIWLISD
jgi:hypothetical protein